MSMLVVPGMVVDAANTHGVYPFLTEIFPASDLVDKLVANFAFQHGSTFFVPSFSVLK